MTRIVFLVVLLFSMSVFAQARKSSGGSKAKKFASVGVMALSSSVSQGGTGPSGSSILTRSEFVWAYQYWGIGAMFDYDLHGENEKDSAYGVKLETYLSNVFFEFGYFLSAKRAYTDRAVADETGTGTVLGLGARFPVGKGGRSFFHASYKMKTQTLTEQDGIKLSESITQTYGYPVFGFGISF